MTTPLRHVELTTLHFFDSGEVTPRKFYNIYIVYPEPANGESKYAVVINYGKGGGVRHGANGRMSVHSRARTAAQAEQTRDALMSLKERKGYHYVERRDFNVRNNRMDALIQDATNRSQQPQQPQPQQPERSQSFSIGTAARALSFLNRGDIEAALGERRRLAATIEKWQASVAEAQASLQAVDLAITQSMRL